MITKKACLLGASSVGKTSLVRRFVEGAFSDRYLTTVGVKIVKKDVELDGQTIRLVLWDLSGEDDFAQLRSTYLRGSSGCFAVVDPTRPDTLEKASELRDRASEQLGGVPLVTLFNKADLKSEWKAPIERGALETSAKTGEGVEEAFLSLARAMLGKSAGS